MSSMRSVGEESKEEEFSHFQIINNKRLKIFASKQPPKFKDFYTPSLNNLKSCKVSNNNINNKKYFKNILNKSLTNKNNTSNSSNWIGTNKNNNSKRDKSSTIIKYLNVKYFLKNFFVLFIQNIIIRQT